MRAIDADALIADLEYDVERDAKALDSMDSVGRDWETIWFDKNCKQNAIDLLQHAPTIEPQQRWIQCSERLPEEHIGFYLVTVRKRRITALNVVGCDNTVHDIDIARWDYDRCAPQRGYHWCKADKVIAWMPLPEPYREGES